MLWHAHTQSELPFLVNMSSRNTPAKPESAAAVRAAPVPRKPSTTPMPSTLLLRAPCLASCHDEVTMATPRTNATKDWSQGIQSFGVRMTSVGGGHNHGGLNSRQLRVARLLPMRV